MQPSKPPCAAVCAADGGGTSNASRVTTAPTLCLHYRTNEVTTYPLLGQVHAEVIGQSVCGQDSIGVAVYQENGRSRDCDGFRNAGGQCTLYTYGGEVSCGRDAYSDNSGGGKVRALADMWPAVVRESDSCRLLIIAKRCKSYDVAPWCRHLHARMQWRWRSRGADGAVRTFC